MKQSKKMPSQYQKSRITHHQDSHTGNLWNNCFKYGKVTRRGIIAKYIKIVVYNYNMPTSITKIFDMVDDYEEIAAYATSPITTKQSIDIAYSIFLSTGKLNQELCHLKRKNDHRPNMGSIQLTLTG